MKPACIPPNYDAISAELRALPIWLAWDYRLVKGRWTKFPYGSSTDPNTWSPFEKIKTRKADGIGFAFAHGFCGVDLDCCRIRETGEIRPWARELIERFNSYVEISPSATGFHIVVKAIGEIPADGVKRGGKDKGWEIAFYSRGRYFCATGEILEDYATVREVDAATIQKFYEELR